MKSAANFRLEWIFHFGERGRGRGKKKWNLLVEGRGERLIPDLQYFPLSGRKTERGRCQLVCNGFIQTWWKPAPRRILTKLFWQWNPPLLIFNKATATFSQRCKGTEIDNSIWRYSIFEAISFQENLDEQGSQVSKTFSPSRDWKIENR